MHLKATRWNLVFALAALTISTDAAAPAFAQDSAKLIIVQDGKPAATIVVPAKASAQEIFAADELQTYVKKVSGATLEIKNDGQAIDVVDGVLIAIGNSQPNAAADLGADKLPPEGYRIKITKSLLSLTGKDDVGTQLAVYAFLESLGVRWLWPGETGEVIPKVPTIEVNSIDQTQQPDFKWRSRGSGGALWGDPKGAQTEMASRQSQLGVSVEHQHQVQLWERRNRWGGWQVYGGHSLGEMFPPEKYAKTHPEYYALINGVRKVPDETYDYKHGGQICTSNPEVIKVAVAWVNDFFDKHPDYDAVEVSLNDGGGFCQCDNCLALDAGGEVKGEGIEAQEMAKGEARQRTVITDRVFTYVNQIAEDVQRTHPGKYVVSFAYGPYTNPPKKLNLHPFAVAQYCLWSCYRHADPKMKQEHDQIAAGWAKASPRKAIYEYYINGSWPGAHRLFPQHLAESIKSLKSLGYDLYQTQAGDDFAINGLNYYLASKLLWNTSLDPQKIIDDFYEKGFGKAAPSIRRFHQRLESAWDNATKSGKEPTFVSDMNDALLNVYPPELLSQCEQDLTEATTLADDDQIRARVEFYKKGLRFTELSLDAARAMRQVLDLGLDPNPAKPPAATIQPATKSAKQGAQKNLRRVDQLTPQERLNALKLVDAALAAWKLRTDYVEAQKNDYVLSYFWVEYNNRTRGFNREKQLKELAAALRSP